MLNEKMAGVEENDAEKSAERKETGDRLSQSNQKIKDEIEANDKNKMILMLLTVEMV